MNATVANALGIVSLLFWSMNVAVTRHLGEAHALGMPGLSFTTSGLILLAFDAFRRTPPPWRSDADRRFWLLGGGAYVLYLLLYVSGLSWSPSRDLVLPLGLINYLWPSLILVMMPLFFVCRIRMGALAAGVLLCVAGIALALLWGLSPDSIIPLLRGNWPAVLMMAAAAFLWAFYSNAARKWGGNANGSGWFQLTSGLCFLALWARTGEPLGFGAQAVFTFLVHAFMINAAAYLLWDYGIRYGNLGLMGTLANFLPLGSIVFGAWYLGDATTPGLWLGCLLVTAGAILCHRGVDMKS